MNKLPMFLKPKNLSVFVSWREFSDPISLTEALGHKEMFLFRKHLRKISCAKLRTQSIVWRVANSFKASNHPCLCASVRGVPENLFLS